MVCLISPAHENTNLAHQPCCVSGSRPRAQRRSFECRATVRDTNREAAPNSAPAPDSNRDPSATPTASPSTTPIVTPTLTPTPPDNTFLTGLYAYYELDEASGAAMDSYGTRTLANFGNPVGTAAGKINTSRNFPGGNAYFCSLNTTDFSPGSNHFFFSLWAKAGNLTQGQSDTGLLSKTGTANNKQWILFYKNTNSETNAKRQPQRRKCV